MHLRILPDHQNQDLKKDFFHLWSGLKRVLMHTSTPPDLSFDAFPDYQNQVLKKLFVSHLGWLKTCFNAFAHTSRPL